MRRPTLREIIRMRSYEDAKARFRDYATQRVEADGAKALPLTGPVGWYPLGQQPSLLVSEQSDSQLAAIYSKSDLVFACVLELQQAVPEAPIQVVYENADGEEEVADDHDALTLFYENPLYSYSDLLNLLVGRVALTGASFAHLGYVEQRFEGIDTLTPLPTSVVGMSSNGPRPTEFSISASDDRKIVVPPDEMCWHLRLDPAAYLKYVSPLAAALRHYSLDVERTDLTHDILHNRNIPPGFFVPKDLNPTKKQRQQFMDSYEAQVSAESGNRSKVPMLPKGVDFVKGAEFTDIDFSQLAAMSESRICMVFQVSPILIGARVGMENSTFANYDSARKSFYKETISAWWTFIAAGYTRAIFGEQTLEEREYYFRFDKSAIPELQDDKKTEAERAALLFEKGVVKRSVAQRIAGVEIEEDETLANEYATKAAPTLPKPDGEKRVDEYSRLFVSKQDEPSVDYSISAVGDFETANIVADLKKETKKQQNDMLRQIARGKLPALTAEHDERLAASLRPSMSKVYERAARDTLVGLAAKSGGTNWLEAKAGDAESIEGAFNVVEPEIKARLDQQLTQLSAEVNGYTNKSIEAAIKNISRNAVQILKKRELLIKAVRKVFKNLEDYRVERIAKTEWSRAQHDAQIISAANTGIVQGMETVVSRDACEICQVYDDDGVPTGKAQHPYQSIDAAMQGVGRYDSKSPPFHVNCRCTQVAVLIGEEIPEVEDRQVGANVELGETAGDV